MGAFLDKPKIDKQNDSGEGNGLTYGLSSMQGWRIEMEDAHCAVTGLPGNLAKWSFFAVFDGHAGARISAHCAQQLLNAIVETDDFKKLDPDAVPPFEDVQRGIRDGFLNLDSKMRKIPEVELGQDKSGSTAVCVLISPHHIYFANCGDSRGILVRDGKVALATMDHKPINPVEKERIQNAGGSVMIQRVNGSLAVSRSLGDYDYKNVCGRGPTEQLVSPEPEIFSESRDDKDQFIVLACDGIWDVMTNEELCSFVLDRARVRNSLSAVCDDVVDTCLHKGSRDNMSVIIIAFDKAHSVDEAAVARDKALDRLIETKVTEKMNENSKIDLMELLCQLQASINAEDLPPGGGLAAKKALVESLYQKWNPEYESYD
ncbi:hypothetical protein BOX15_Mlig030480g1 [Macrostomum lignano]|uniref:PPM-type phosphatase domain-containing protein n=1 Tax=Macrostomum lignano TaxID=282301 RepID=A0A267G927_9PLAT|nr:hypothetical protein BOX15_Mlig005651g1 [Macrostomum lignano]PAA81742.1 hypothetical protein BOX15_Mlig029481g1 [Macrostomum lignano]PAA89417.1 hypothetical protein BOX15_Mlig030480g1 [Macrostomum lignano]